MQKNLWISAGMFAVLLLGLTVSCTPVESNSSSYAEDRAQIEDLQARYMFALDFSDYDTYVSTFTEDGILDIIGWQAQGREEIRNRLTGSGPEPEEQLSAEEQGPYPATGRHNITNIVLKIDGDTAVGRAYWFHYGNNNPERKADIDSYGYYEDEMVKVDGQWLFSKRVIFNEQVKDWIGSRENPCW
ncbi:MAG: nuclear transport factor 2 family protein [Acidobacteriota bacterium]|jgi:3-phenylpropionate/cinnamic acid dioxygenase small subunit